MEYRVIIAGSRSCPENSEELFSWIFEIFGERLTTENTEIVSGKAKGGDRLGENYANAYGYKIKEFPADWDKYGKQAGYIRNKQMAEYASHLIAFWDFKSKGTGHMIDLAKSQGLTVRIIEIK